MSAQSAQKGKRVRLIAVLFAALFVLFIGTPTSAFALTSGGSAEVGVYVEPTIPPAPPPTAPRVSIPPLVTPPATLPVPVPVTEAPPLTTDDSLLQEFNPPQEVPADAPKSFVESVKSVAKSTSKFMKNVTAGTPVADAAQAILPEAAAAVVVPAIRTASTFVFPIGLAGAVVAFLALQQRIDSTDPKLRAAPIAHGDDMVTFS